MQVGHVQDHAHATIHIKLCADARTSSSSQGMKCARVHQQKMPKVCDAEDDAEWRSQRLTTAALLRREWERGKRVSPIFSVFGVTNSLFKIDWLHVADQGISADFLGNEFDYIVKHKMPGNNKLEKCRALGEHVYAYYGANNVQDKLKEFLPKTFKSEKASRPPRLKGNAASTRALVKFGKNIAERFLSDDVPMESAIKSAARSLNMCYESLRNDHHAFSYDALYSHSKYFALQYKALHAAVGDGVSWRPMPKMHLFLELCSSRTEPAKFWNYRDEDFGSSIARQSRMKGMWKRVSTYSRHALDMFKMKNRAPRLVVAA